MINEGSKRVLFTKKQIVTLANEFAGFFKGFKFGSEGEALLNKEILKQYFQEAMKHDSYEESVDITKPKLSLFLKMIKRDDSIFFRLYEVRSGRESDILKITLNSTTKNWSVRRFDLNERETMKSKIIKENYSNNGYGMSDDALSFVVDGEIESERMQANEDDRDVSNLDNLQINEELVEANRAYGAKIHELLANWLHENLDKMTPIKELYEEGVISYSEYKNEDVEETYLDLLMRYSSGAVFLYFMEYRGEGVGTWDGPWNILFVDGRHTVDELRKYIEENSSEEAEELQTAIENNVYEYANSGDDEDMDLNESFKRIIKEWNGADETDVVIYTTKHIKAWIPTYSSYARDFARGWITVWIYNEETHEDITLEGKTDGDFIVVNSECGEHFNKDTCSKYLSCDEDVSESIYEGVSKFDYEDFMVGLLDGSEDDPTTELSQEAIETAKQESINSLENLIREYIINYHTQYDMDNVVKDVLENIDTKLDWNDFEVEWDSMGNAYAEMIDFQKEEEPEVVEAIINALKKYNLLDPEAISESELDLDESFNNIFNTYINEDDSYKWDKELNIEDLQYLIDQEFFKYEDRYEFTDHPHADHFAIDTFDVFLRRCKNIIDEFAHRHDLSFYDIVEDIRGPYQLAIYNYLNGDLSHIMNNHPKKLYLDAMARDDIKPQFEYLQKAIRNCIKSYIV